MVVALRKGGQRGGGVNVALSDLEPPPPKFPVALGNAWQKSSCNTTPSRQQPDKRKPASCFVTINLILGPSSYCKLCIDKLDPDFKPRHTKTGESRKVARWDRYSS